MPSVKFSSLVKKSDITQKITSDLTLYVQHPLSPLLICSMCHVLCTACFVCNEVRLVAFIFEAHDIYISVFSEKQGGESTPSPSSHYYYYGGGEVLHGTIATHVGLILKYT